MVFNPGPFLQSGIFIPGNGKALVKLSGANNQYLLAASQNRGPLKVFRLEKNQKLIQLAPLDVKATIHIKTERFWSRNFIMAVRFCPSRAGLFA